MNTDQALSTYYAIFSPGDKPGFGEFLRCDPNSGGSAAGPLDLLPEGSGAVFIFSTKAKAEEVMRRRSLGDDWSAVGLGVAHTEDLLRQGKARGIHQYVAFNPGAVIVDVQPVDEFIASMPYRTLKNSGPAP